MNIALLTKNPRVSISKLHFTYRYSYCDACDKLFYKGTDHKHQNRQHRLIKLRFCDLCQIVGTLYETQDHKNHPASAMTMEELAKEFVPVVKEFFMEQDSTSLYIDIICNYFYNEYDLHSCRGFFHVHLRRDSGTGEPR